MIMDYQIKPKSTADILKKDGERLKSMVQPNQVQEQLDQLYRFLTLYYSIISVQCLNRHIKIHSHFGFKHLPSLLIWNIKIIILINLKLELQRYRWYSAWHCCPIWGYELERKLDSKYWNKNKFTWLSAKKQILLILTNSVLTRILVLA